MSWGAYWMYYDCKNCGEHYRWSLDYISSENFAHCPNCGEENPLAFEAKDLTPETVGQYAYYKITED